MLFGHTDGWWNKFLRGYTHVALMELVGSSYAIAVDPAMSGANMGIRGKPDEDDTEYEMLYVRVRAQRKNHLIRFKIQTCATIIQYLMHTDLGVITAQGMYERLTEKPQKWLRKRGIMEVTRWEWKQQL